MADMSTASRLRRGSFLVTAAAFAACASPTAPQRRDALARAAAVPARSAPSALSERPAAAAPAAVPAAQDPPPAAPPAAPPRQATPEEVETGADPSRLLLRAEWASQFVQTPGPGNLFVNNLKLDVPFADGKAVAVELPVVSTTLPQPLDDAFGLGDTFLRGRQVTNSDTGSTIVGVEFGLDTATDPVLGSGKWQANPSFAYVHRFTPTVLLAGALKQRLSVAGDEDRSDLNRSETRLIGILLHPQGRWLILDWQPSFDWNRDGRMSNVLEAEAGMMWSRAFGLSFRPGMAFGGYQDRDFSVQIGMRLFF